MQEVRSSFQQSEEAIKKALQRLKRKKEIAQIRIGFYVIVTPEYRSKGTLPPSLFVADMMKYLEKEYYVALLNAAAYLFDMWFAITQTDVNIDQIIEAWNFYMKEDGNTVSQKEFLENMERKIEDQDFLTDMAGLLRPGLKYDIRVAHDFVKTTLLEKI